MTHDYSGPRRVERFDYTELPIKEQWMYHAVSDIYFFGIDGAMTIV